MTRAEGAGRPLAMHEQPPGLAVHLVGLFLAGVVRDIVEKLQLRIGIDAGKHLAGEMGDDLAVGQGAVDTGAHGAKITLSHRRTDGRAGQFPIRQPDAVFLCGERHLALEFGADLMAQPA